MWEWGSPRTERMQTMQTKAEVQIYHPGPAHGLDDSPSEDAVQENRQRSFSFRCWKVQVHLPSKAMGHSHSYTPGIFESKRHMQDAHHRTGSCGLFPSGTQAQRQTKGKQGERNDHNQSGSNFQTENCHPRIKSIAEGAPEERSKRNTHLGRNCTQRF